MAERKNSEAGPGRHSHAIPAPSFPTHNSPRTWFLTQALSPLAIRLIRLLLAHGDYVVACLPPHELADDDRSAEFRELANECRASGGGGGGPLSSSGSGGASGSGRGHPHHPPHHSKDRDREGWKDRIRGIRCDARLMGQCAAAVAEAVQVFGRIDILLCCQSEAVVGAVEELVDPGTASGGDGGGNGRGNGGGDGLGGSTLIRDQLETNFFSQVNLIKAALPQLRAQHTGHIMVLTSIGGHIGTPWLPVYTAATWALEGYCDSLAYEIAPFNIKVTIVQPNMEVQMLTNKVVLAPPMGEYSSPTTSVTVPVASGPGNENNPANPANPANLTTTTTTVTVPSIRDVMTNVLNAHPDTAVPTFSSGSGQTQQTPTPAPTTTARYPKLAPAALDRLVLETVHALTAIGGHENPPARHIVGFEASAAVQDKLKTVSEELEDFVEASLAVDIFESELKAEAREGRPAVAPSSVEVPTSVAE